MTNIQTKSLKEDLSRARRLVSEGEVKKYKEDGYLLLRGLVPPETAQALHGEVMEIMNIIGLGHTKLRQTAQYRRGSLLESYVQSALLRETAAALMEAPAHLYLPFTAVKSGGGGGQFHFHQDGNYTRYVRGQGVNLWMALTPMREENGGLRIVPGSHLGGEMASENAGDGDAHRKVVSLPEGNVLIEMEPGDCVAFTRWTVHGSGANHTDNPRVAYAVQFHSSDVVAMVDGKEQVLLDKPRFTDIWGVDEIVAANAGSRDGH